MVRTLGATGNRSPFAVLNGQEEDFTTPSSGSESPVGTVRRGERTDVVVIRGKPPALRCEQETTIFVP